MTYDSSWLPLWFSIFEPHRLAGQDPEEWLALMRHDYDEVDRMMIDAETQGA